MTVRRYQRIFISGFLMPIILLGLYNNCSERHYSWTSSNNGSVIAGNPMVLSSSKILTAVCKVVTRCHSNVAETDCENSVAKVNGMALPLGVSAWGYNSLESIEQAESAGLLAGQMNSADLCSTDIAATDCSSSAAQAAYDPLSSQPFAGSTKLVAGSSCGGSFVAAGNSSLCPTNYVQVPPLVGYTSQNFCISKYEMKNSSNVPAATAAGVPWVLISRNDAITACRSLGTYFDLISNAEWQTTARNIANQPINWSTGVAYSGDLNRGYSDDIPGVPQSASPDDNQACYGTLQTCSSTVWNSQRRTHVLSNGGVVWDLAGNDWEWVSDDNTKPAIANDYVINFTGSWQTDFGNDKICPGPSVCGFGGGQLSAPQGAIARGETNSGGIGAGVFAVDLRNSPQYANSIIGFRCVYRPPQ
ncbi:MAG: SUMF1/EgtB/PvdO family nonheme iron enzyme [Pseudobdellovibrionaceae bacterium]